MSSATAFFLVRFDFGPFFIIMMRPGARVAVRILRLSFPVFFPFLLPLFVVPFHSLAIVQDVLFHHSKFLLLPSHGFFKFRIRARAVVLRF